MNFLSITERESGTVAAYKERTSAHELFSLLNYM